MAKLDRNENIYSLNGELYTGDAFSSHLEEDRSGMYNSRGWDGHSVGVFTTFEEARQRASKFCESDTLYFEMMRIENGVMTSYDVVEKY